MRVPYSGKRMPPSQARPPVPSARFVVELLALGSLGGVALLLIDAPIWTFYIAPVLTLPILLHELRAIDGADASDKRGRASRWTGSGAKIDFLRDAPAYRASKVYWRLKPGVRWALLMLSVVGLIGSFWGGLRPEDLFLLLPSLLVLFLSVGRGISAASLNFDLRSKTLESRALRSRTEVQVLEVFPCEGEWAVRAADGGPWISHFESQAEACDGAIAILRSHGGELILRDEDGEIRRRQKFIAPGDALHDQPYGAPQRPPPPPPRPAQGGRAGAGPAESHDPHDRYWEEEDDGQ